MLQQFNCLMDYIEEHLMDELSGSEISQMVGVSEYHFRRMFSFVAGMPLSEYIKNRRLATANVDLINGKTVTDVAFKYGYQSVDGFSRAFRNWSGLLPSEVYKNKMQKTFPKFTFFIDVRGGVSMEFKIETKEKFNLVGVTKVVSMQFEGENNAIIELAQSITDKQRKEMHELGNLYPHQVLNVSYNFDEGRLKEEGSLTHMLGFATTKEKPFDDLEQITVESNTWAIFPVQGPFPSSLQNTWAKIYAEWLPSSNYELVHAPEISFTKHTGSYENVYSEIWIAVKEKLQF